MANNLIRNKVKRSAHHLNSTTVRVAELLEENFEGVHVYVDQVTENEESINPLISINEFGEIEVSTTDDFIVIESGDFFPQTNNSRCYIQEQTTITFVSNNRPDIIEDNLTIIEVMRTANMNLQNLTKTIQPLGNTSNQITVVTATFTRSAETR